MCTRLRSTRQQLILDDGPREVACANAQDASPDLPSDLSLQDVGGVPTAPALRLLADRRRLPRRSVQGGAMAVFASSSGAGTIARVTLTDASWTGLGALSPIDVPHGTRVTIKPDHAMMPRQVGVVVRSAKREDGQFDLGVRCETAKAVA